MIRNCLYGFYSANMFLAVRVWLETLGKESGTDFYSLWTLFESFQLNSYLLLVKLCLLVDPSYLISPYFAELLLLASTESAIPHYSFTTVRAEVHLG